MDTSNLQQLEKKLEKANSIIKEIVQNERYITPITPSDHALFDDFFDREKEHTYGNSWIYVTQGTFGIGPEKLGYKYDDGKNLCALAMYPKIEDPNTIVLYWIRPMGENILPIIAEYAERIKRKYGVCSYVKKLFPEQFEFLLQHGFSDVKHFPWHSTAPMEDDTYPEIIYDREKTREAILNTTKRHALGSTLRQILKLDRDNNVQLSSTNFQKHAWDIVTFHFKKHGEFSKKTNVSSPADYYNTIFDNHIYNNGNIQKKILFVNNKPLGFYVLSSNLTFDVTTLYSCIVKRDEYKCLADYLYIKWFDTATTKYINLGGSEDDGIRNFKEKYLPTERKHMHWTTNYPL
jgi:hypothetical protein